MSPVIKLFIRGRIPLWLKVLYTAFMAVLVPNYLINYGPTNFLYFCDIALLMTVVAIWMESSLWASAALVGILVAQLVWMADFIAGARLLALTGYMFDPEIPFFTRGLSFFHFWLPILLIYLVWRLGYDHRGYLFWTIPACLVLLPVCYYLMPPPPTPDPNLPANINYVYGFVKGTEQPQQWLSPDGWFAFEMIGMPLAVWLPTHFALGFMFRPAKTV